MHEMRKERSATVNEPAKKPVHEINYPNLDDIMTQKSKLDDTKK